jgi:hypothetical protein
VLLCDWWPYGLLLVLYKTLFPKDSKTADIPSPCKEKAPLQDGRCRDIRLTFLDYERVEGIQNPSEASHGSIDGGLSVRSGHSLQPRHSVKSNQEAPESSYITSVYNQVTSAVHENDQDSPLAEPDQEVPHSELSGHPLSTQITTQSNSITRILMILDVSRVGPNSQSSPGRPTRAILQDQKT